MYQPKICPICGDEFIPNSSRQKYCNKPIIRKCAICNNDYVSTCSPNPVMCCSKACRDKYAHQQASASYSKIKKICILCGKEFTPRNNTQKICDSKHYKKCEVCGREFEIDTTKEIRCTCSKECHTKLIFANGNPFSDPESREKAKQTLLDKYGADHPMHSEEIKAKLDNTMMERYGVKRFTQIPGYEEQVKQTNQERYGTDWPIQNSEILQKSKDTLFSHYGVTSTMHSEEIVAKRIAEYKEKTGYENPLQNPEVREKGKDTLLDRYGVDHPSKSPDILAKTRDTMTQRFGVPYVMQSPTLRDKIANTNLIRYGYENAASSPEIQKKISDTMVSKYGYVRYSQTDDWHLSVMMDPSRIDYFNEFKKEPREFIHKYFNDKPILPELFEITGVGYEAIVTVLDKFNCRDEVAFKYSTMEREVANILLTLDPNIQIVYHTHKIISPYEIDIYLPEYKIGIECDPTATHNSSVGFLDDKNEPTPKNYHRMKSDLAEQQGVFLFHLFGYEWKYKRDIIVSMLRNLIGRNENKIYARNTIVREVDSPTAVQFLNANHRQGRVFSPIRLGLYNKKTNELVSLMTFGKLRKTMGINKGASDDIWELTRFCNKINTSVIGGASKLFKYFVDNYQPEEIRSFSDRAHTRGNLYSTLGFTELRRSGESYVWIDLKTDRAFHRIHAQKHNIKRFLNDYDIDLNQTEFQIMESHGFVSLFDSGTITWQWTVR